jgi:hypothetical protein
VSVDFTQLLRTQSNAYSVQDIHGLHQSDDLIVCPNYKHSFDWDIAKKSKFVESLMVGLPVSGFWFEQNNYGALNVIDGTQRIWAFVDFIEGEFELIGMSIMRQFEGFSFNQLEYKDRLNLLRSTIPVQIINYDASPALKCEFHKRYNIGNSKSNAQQARNFAYKKAFGLLTSQKKGLKSKIEFKKNDPDTLLSAEHFFLCLLLVQMLVEQPNKIPTKSALGNVLDFIMAQLDFGIITVKSQFMKTHIAAVLAHLDVTKASLVRRKTIKSSRPRKTIDSKYIPLNKFLKLFLISSIWGLNSETAKKLDTFNFFKEDNPVAQLLDKIGEPS